MARYESSLAVRPSNISAYGVKEVSAYKRAVSPVNHLYTVERLHYLRRPKNMMKCITQGLTTGSVWLPIGKKTEI